MEKTNKRNNNIELLRLAFCIFIILLHYCEQFGYFGALTFRGGYLGVEFFFMVTGTYLAKSIKERRETILNDNMWKYCRDNIIHKLMAIIPYFIVATIIGYLVTSIGVGSIKSAIIGLLGVPQDIFLLNNYGFSGRTFTGIAWYISAMFFALMILQPIVIKFYDAYVKYFSVLIFLISYGAIIYSFQTINVPNKYIFIFNTGFLRAIGMMSIGMFVFELSNYLKRIDVNSCLVSFLEIVLYFYIFIYMMFLQEIEEMETGIITAVIALIIAFSITLSEKSIFNGKFSNSIVTFLGKSTLVLFMNHMYWFYHLKSILNMFGLNFNNSKFIIILITVIAISSLITYSVGSIIKKYINGIIKKVIRN